MKRGFLHRRDRKDFCFYALEREQAGLGSHGNLLKSMVHFLLYTITRREKTEKPQYDRKKSLLFDRKPENIFLLTI